MMMLKPLSKILLTRIGKYLILYNETRTLTTTPLDLRNYSDDQKKDLLKKNSIIIMRFHGNDREAILVKTNPTKAVVYMNDQLYCISYKSIVEYKGQKCCKKIP